MDRYLLAIDQGTTSSRAILFDAGGRVLDVQQKELTLHYPHKGWVEQDANDIWNDTLWCVRGIVAALGADASKIAALGVTNQRETTILWDRKTGVPVYNAIVWQDRRTAEFCATLKQAGCEGPITDKTGLLLDPYFSASKIAWILDNVEGARARAEAGDLAFGTVDSYVLWKLTGGRVHASDVTNAARTMLYNIVAQQWDEDLLRLFNIPAAILPQVKDNVADFGVTDAGVIGAAIPIGGMAGDQQAALIGQACFDHGMVKATYGTGCFALMTIGADFKPSQNRLLTTPAYCLNGAVTYALEGSIFTAGAAVQWLRDNLGLFDDAAQSDALARSVPDNNGVYFVPAFTGLGAPYWRPDARGMICGLSRESAKAHIVRAALEAQAYQTLDLMGAMEGDSGLKVAQIRADGGLMANDFVGQFLADMLDRDIAVPDVLETTAWGAACLAGLSAGVFGDLNDIAQQYRQARLFQPQMAAQDRAALYQGWRDSVQCLLRD
ncbi:MAG: glycerol kinase GlpK [Bdellovibrionales bacterium]